MIEYFIAITSQFIVFILQYKAYLLYACSMFLGAAGAWFISRTPLRLQLMDRPNERSSHIMPVPRGGGFGIFLAVILCGLSLKLPTSLLFPAVMLAMISFYGDFFQLSVKLRLIVQFIMAMILVFPQLPAFASYYIMMSRLALFPILVFLIPALTVVYLVGSANFYNFMDGINGMAGLSGAISFGLLGAFCLIYLTNPYSSSFSILSFCIALACLGFLPFNMPKARVFMGDVGSILLGFVFSGLAVMVSRNYFDLLCVSSFLFPFYVDVLTTMTIRLKDRENLIIPHRRHLYQLLANELGIAQWKVSTGYGVFQLLIGATIMMLYPRGARLILTVLGAYFFIFVITSAAVRRHVNHL